MAGISDLAGRRLRLVANASILVELRMSSSLWGRLLQQALQQVPGLDVRILDAVHHAALPAEAGVLVTVAPSSRIEWERLAQWCRGDTPARVLVLGENRSALAARVLRFGASGYLDWESSLSVLVKAIRGVAAGELWAERKVALALVRGPHVPTSSSRLTHRERAVLEALAEGRRNKEIADKLAISEATVKSHLNRAYHKLHLSDRLQAALYLERHGMDL